MTDFRTDRNNNPTAFTTGVARIGGLILGKDYEQGDSFLAKFDTLYTAKLLGDPIALTIKVIDTATYYTMLGYPRWTYIAIPKFIWDSLTPELKKQVIGFQYEHEGGTAMKGLFT
jgi:hypothetical protein